MGERIRRCTNGHGGYFAGDDEVDGEDDMDGQDDFDDVDGEDDMGENEDDFIINAILDIYNIDIQNITADEVKRLEFAKSLRYLKDLRNNDPLMFVAYIVDDENKLQHLFLCDDESQMNYKVFGDVGVRGHYDRGKRLIIKVFDVEPATTPPPQYANENAQNPPHKKMEGMLEDGVGEGFEGTGDVGGIWDGGEVSR
ncbi:hypothetical protein JHK86_050687 [Glycine max]|nr:hypothetical protein JHK86_050687 [Glycine max]